MINTAPIMNASSNPNTRTESMALDKVDAEPPPSLDMTERTPADMAATHATRHRPSGFTLIELLVTLAILSALMSVLLPAMSAARRSAQASACLANLHRLGVSTFLYLEKSDDVFPPMRLSTVNGVTYVNEYGASQPRWQWFIGFDLGPIINPPADSAGPWGDSYSTTITNDYFTCPSLVGAYRSDIRNGAYGYNYQYLGNSRTDAAPGIYDHFPVSSRSIVAPDLTVLIADSRGADRDHGKHSYTLDPPRLAVEKNARKFGPGAGDGPIGHSPAEARHRGAAATVFVDGHAELATPLQLGYAIGPDGVVVPEERGDIEAPMNRLWTGRGEDAVERRDAPR